MTKSPQVATILNITPNHLDRHKTIENYIQAKANILKYQSNRDIVILGKDDGLAGMLEIIVPGELAWFSQQTMVSDGAFLLGERLFVAGVSSYDSQPHMICTLEDIPLRGDHNVANVLAACAVTGAIGLVADSPGIEPELMKTVIQNFEGVPHRLEVVRELKGVTYINDSIATAPERLIAALKSFKERLILLIGGADKDLSWNDALIFALSQSRQIIVFGKEGEKQVSSKVRKTLETMRVDLEAIIFVETLDEAVAQAHELAEEGDVVLLSPGGTSYDAYQDFAQRGEHFRLLVDALQ